MFVKYCLSVFLVTSVLFSQGRVEIAGVVRDARTEAAVVGARVRLLRMDISALTDSAGRFMLTGTSLLRPGKKVNGWASPATGSLLYLQDREGPVEIRIFDCSGRQREVIFSGKLGSGIWRITPPRLSPGIYLCRFDSPLLHSAVGFIASTPGTDIEARTAMIRKITDAGSGTPQSSLIERKAASSPADSLIVEKNGYRPARIPLDGYQKTGLTILLEDTAGTVDDDVTIIPDPSWTCFMPDGIPPPRKGEAVFSITLQYSAIHNVGMTKFGRRRQFDISGGSVSGSKITATVLSGGLDYELTLSNGSIELEQIVILRAGSTPILMRNAGVAPAGAKSVRVVLDFEAPNSSSYTWLHTGKFAADRVVDSVKKTIKLDVYDISKVAITDKKIQIKDPPDVPNQTWDCLKFSGTQGATVFTENVTLGGSISIGASKRGNRNIIPITGGTTSGKVTGKILSGGADYQLGGLDARYTLAPNDGEFIIVRNCGSGTLYPVFEARVDGPYNFLNENKYISSAPGMGSGGVTITFYERK